MATASLYIRTMARLDKFVPPRFLPLWNHPAGEGFADLRILLCNHFGKVQDSCCRSENGVFLLSTI